MAPPRGGGCPLSWRCERGERPRPPDQLRAPRASVRSARRRSNWFRLGGFPARTLAAHPRRRFSNAYSIIRRFWLLRRPAVLTRPTVGQTAKTFGRLRHNGVKTRRFSQRFPQRSRETF